MTILIKITNIFAKYKSLTNQEIIFNNNYKLTTLFTITK